MKSLERYFKEAEGMTPLTDNHCNRLYTVYMYLLEVRYVYTSLVTTECVSSVPARLDDEDVLVSSFSTPSET